MRPLFAALLVCLCFPLAAAPEIDLPGISTETGITSSSIRWKEKIRPIGGTALRIVCQMRGVYFTWKKPSKADHPGEGEGTRDLGFIAEEVGKLVPELVEWEVEGKVANGLKYDRVTALTVEAIKEQQRVIDQLVLTVATMQSQLAAHEVRLCAQDSKIAAQDKRICGLETQVGTLQTSVTELKELVRELDFALADVEDKVEALQGGSAGEPGAQVAGQ